MNLRSLVAPLAALVLGSLAVAPVHAAPETYAVDPGHSAILFRIKHLDIGFVYGRFDAYEGSITVDDTDLSKASVKVEVKATSVNTGEPKRDDHLRSPDFFGVAQFPTITFQSTSVKKVGEVAYEVTGNLTLHGVTKPVTVKMEKTGAGKDPWGNTRIGYEGTFDIKRSAFGMDKLLETVGDDVRMILAFEGVRK